jgi:hypothetical protein
MTGGITRKVLSPILSNAPFEYQFDTGTTADEQDAKIKQHQAELFANRDLASMGPQAALGKLLATAQNAITPKSAPAPGPTVIRQGPVWGMSQESTDNYYQNTLANNAKAAELEMQRQENIANRQAQLAKMEQELQLVGQEHQFNLKLKDLEHATRLDEITKQSEIQSKRDEANNTARMEREKYKVENKAPKLVSAYDAKTGTYTLQPEAQGLTTKGAKTPDEINKSAFDIANHLMGYEFVDEKTGERQPMDFATATQAAHAMANGDPVHFDIPGMKLVDRKEQQLAPVTDASGKTTLAPKAAGMTTKEPPAPDRREVTGEYKMQWEIAKDTLKEAQAALDNMPKSPEDDEYDAAKLNMVKADVATAQEEVKKTRSALQAHLSGDKADPNILPPDAQANAPVSVSTKEEVTALPDGSLFELNGKTYKKVGDNAEPQ